MHAQILRKTMTDAEKKLWHKIRNKQIGIRFRMQQPIGNYIVDFVSFEMKITIEIDGGQHYDSADEISREKWLKKQGFTVFRFWNNDVIKNTAGVLYTIMHAISPSPAPSHQGRGKLQRTPNLKRGKKKRSTQSNYEERYRRMDNVEPRRKLCLLT
jgi:very-short-patch-repair endonuclease